MRGVAGFSMSPAVGFLMSFDNGIELTGKRVVTNVAMVHEPGHPEPWIIALSEPPTVHRALDYGLRWGSWPVGAKSPFRIGRA